MSKPLIVYWTGFAKVDEDKKIGITWFKYKGIVKQYLNGGGKYGENLFCI